MSSAESEPWQYNFPPFFTIQPHLETREKQLSTWKYMILEYCKQNKITTLDINEAQNNPPFCNTSINRKLPLDGMITVLEYMSKTGNAAAIDKNKNKWEVYWHSLEEWGNIIYSWASENAMTNSVCTLFEIVQGDNSTDQEFFGLEMNILVKALKQLELKNKCEIIEFDNNQGVKFF